MHLDPDNEVEVRGLAPKKYPQESLHLLSCLWNEQKLGEDFEWQKILEENASKDFGEKPLLDEDEYNHYLYRKERLNQFNQDQEDEQETKLKELEKELKELDLEKQMKEFPDVKGDEAKTAENQAKRK